MMRHPTRRLLSGRRAFSLNPQRQHKEFDE